MEKDPEIKGEGNEYTTEFRQYDARLGRWLSIDPLVAKFAAHSPFNAFLNSPFINVDIKGSEATVIHANSPEESEEIIFTLEEEDVIRVKSPLKKIQESVDNEYAPSGSLEKMIPTNPDDDEHNKNVETAVNYFLETSLGSTLQERLEHARRKLTDLREVSNRNSLSLILRDAERYLWGRAGTGLMKEEGSFEPFTDYLAPWASDVYNFYKFILPEKVITSVPNGPVSAVGGGAWFDRGLRDYTDFDEDNLGNDVLPETYRHADPDWDQRRAK
jgi:hypothetical protein